MSNEPTGTEIKNVSKSNAKGAEAATNDFVTMTIADQLFGIPVLSVHDVLGPQKITHVPLSPPEVAGVLNLRGRIVTAINVRRRLGLPDVEGGQSGMSVAVEYDGESYSLLIDQVGEVLSMSPDAFEQNPVTLDPRWREVAAGIYRMDDGLMVVLDVAKLLNLKTVLAAA
jgi:purine-binding chemotaxis protein CheW